MYWTYKEQQTTQRKVKSEKGRRGGEKGVGWRMQITWGPWFAYLGGFHAL